MNTFIDQMRALRFLSLKPGEVDILEKINRLKPFIEKNPSIQRHFEAVMEIYLAKILLQRYQLEGKENEMNELIARLDTLQENIDALSDKESIHGVQQLLCLLDEISSVFNSQLHDMIEGMDESDIIEEEAMNEQLKYIGAFEESLRGLQGYLRPH